MKNKLPIVEGLVTGVASATFAQVFFTLADGMNRRFAWGLDPSAIDGTTGLMTLVILGAGIYVGMKRTKTANGGNITWRRAFLTGVAISLMVAIIAALAALIYGAFINREFSSSIRKQLTLPMLAMRAFTAQLFAGTILALVMALFIRTRLSK